MDIVKIVEKRKLIFERIKWDADKNHYVYRNNNDERLYLELRRVNNRGWTFEGFGVGSGIVEYFFSRGDYADLLEGKTENN